MIGRGLGDALLTGLTAKASVEKAAFVRLPLLRLQSEQALLRLLQGCWPSLMWPGLPASTQP